MRMSCLLMKLPWEVVMSIILGSGEQENYNQGNQRTLRLKLKPDNLHCSLSEIMQGGRKGVRVHSCVPALTQAEGILSPSLSGALHVTAFWPISDVFPVLKMSRHLWYNLLTCSNTLIQCTLLWSCPTKSLKLVSPVDFHRKEEVLSHKCDQQPLSSNKCDC